MVEGVGEAEGGTGVHDDIIKWKHSRYWPFVRGIHQSRVNSPHKSQWHGASMFSVICAWINGWVNNREAGDLRRHRAHCYLIAMSYGSVRSGGGVDLGQKPNSVSKTITKSRQGKPLAESSFMCQLDNRFNWQNSLNNNIKHTIHNFCYLKSVTCNYDDFFHKEHNRETIFLLNFRNYCAGHFDHRPIITNAFI